MLNRFEAIILESEGQNYKNKVALKIMKLCAKMVASFWKLQKFQKKSLGLHCNQTFIFENEK